MVSHLNVHVIEYDFFVLVVLIVMKTTSFFGRIDGVTLFAHVLLSLSISSTRYRAIVFPDTDIPFLMHIKHMLRVNHRQVGESSE